MLDLFTCLFGSPHAASSACDNNSNKATTPNIYIWWPKKISHYQVSSLNRIKNRQFGYISHQL